MNINWDKIHNKYMKWIDPLGYAAVDMSHKYIAPQVGEVGGALGITDLERRNDEHQGDFDKFFEDNLLGAGTVLGGIYAGGAYGGGAAAGGGGSSASGGAAAGGGGGGGWLSGLLGGGGGAGGASGGGTTGGFASGESLGVLSADAGSGMGAGFGGNGMLLSYSDNPGVAALGGQGSGSLGGTWYSQIMDAMGGMDPSSMSSQSGGGQQQGAQAPAPYGQQQPGMQGNPALSEALARLVSEQEQTKRQQQNPFMAAMAQPQTAQFQQPTSFQQFMKAYEQNGGRYGRNY
jgi:hypothetical protein